MKNQYVGGEFARKWKGAMKWRNLLIDNNANRHKISKAHNIV